MVAGSASADDLTPPGEGEDPVSTQDKETYTGGDMYGDGEFQVGLGTDITAYAPVWRDSIGEDGKWEYDFTIEGCTACRFVDDNGDPIEGDKNERMWWQEITVSDGTDIYSRDDADWIGSSPKDQSQDFDYSSYALARDGITLALTALNPAMGGIGLGATYFLSDMVNWVSSQSGGTGGVFREWDYTVLNGPQWADSSTFLLVRDELAAGTDESFSIQNVAVAFPEYPVITEFDVSFNTPPEPNSLSTQEQEEYGIQKIKPENNKPSPGRESDSDEEIYIADPRKTIDVTAVKNPEVPDTVYDKMAEKREDLELRA